jgi:hypothetical protein
MNVMCPALNLRVALTPRQFPPIKHAMPRLYSFWRMACGKLSM